MMRMWNYSKAPNKDDFYNFYYLHFPYGSILAANIHTDVLSNPGLAGSGVFLSWVSEYT